jgi:hypothetical protein
MRSCSRSAIVYPAKKLCGQHKSIPNNPLGKVTVGSPSCGRRDRLKVRPARVDKVREDIGPVVPLVPRDLCGRVDFDRHHLAHCATLDQHDRGADATCASAALLTALNVCGHERVARGDMCTWYDVCALDNESTSEREAMSERPSETARGKDALPVRVI